MKKGTAAIDWTMALGIFVLYLAWFFVFMRPQLDAEFNKKSLVVMLNDNIMEDYSREIEQVPLFVISDERRQYLPVFVDFPYDWEHMVFMDNIEFIKEGQRIFMLANTSSNSSAHYILHMGNSSNEILHGLLAGSTWVTTLGNMSVHFIKSVPNKMDYVQTKVNSTSLVFNSVPYEPDSFYYNDSSLVATYYSESESISLTNFIYARNAQVHSFVSMTQSEELVAEITYNFLTYTHYYSNNNFFGMVTDENIAYSYNSITLYNSHDAMTLFFEDEVAFELDDKSLKITIDADGPFEYRIIFHDGDFTNINRQDYELAFGLVDTIEGISLADLDEFEYSIDKRRWNFPDARNFQIVVWNSTKNRLKPEEVPIFQAGPRPDQTSNIYSEKLPITLLEDDGSTRQATLDIRVW